MSLYIRYKSRFKDIDQTMYNIEIWQESDNAFAVEDIVLAREAITIEWSKRDKLEPIRSSAATLRILCQSDQNGASGYLPGGFSLLEWNDRYRII